MSDLAITNSNKFGKNEQVSTILLSEAIMADETENMRVHQGEYKAVKGRLKEIADDENVKIQTPTDFYAITSIVSGTKTINITGDHSAGNTPLIVGATIRINGSLTTANNIEFTVDTLPTTSSIVVLETITTQGASGNVFVGATPIIEHHRHVRQANEAEFLLLATAYHIWSWDGTNKILTEKFTSGSPGTATHWSIVTHLDDVYATNNVDLIQRWQASTSPSSDFADLGSASGVDIDGVQFVIAARFLASFESYLFLFYVTYDDNSIYPLRTHHSSLSDPTDFDINGAGDAGAKDFNSTPDSLVGVGFWQDNIIVFKRQRHIRGTLVQDDAVFTWDQEELKVGALSQHAIINDRAGRLFFLASDLSIREIRSSIQISLLADKTIKQLNTSVIEFAQMAFIDVFGTINLALAIGSSETNNKIISFNPDTADTAIDSFPVRSFGIYTRQAKFTYNTLPYATYADWGTAWGKYDFGGNVVGFPLILSSDYNGNTFDFYMSETDDEQPMTRSLVFNTNLGEIFPHKRVNNGMYGIFRRQPEGQVLMYIRNSIESGWRLLGNDGIMLLTDSRGPEFVTVHLPFDERFQNAQFKAESTDRMEIIGFIFRDFNIEDDR